MCFHIEADVRENSCAKSSLPDLLIVLVHGTRARGFFPGFNFTKTRKPYWFESTSHFSKNLIKGLQASGHNPSIGSIMWSGSNLFFAREKAAKQLVAYLKDQRAIYPDIPIVIVGHSHGGNVALRAFGQLRENSNGFHLATLATPFIQGFRMNQTSAQKDIFPFIVSAFVGTMIFNPYYFITEGYWSKGSNKISFALLMIKGFAYTIIVFLLLLAAAILWLKYLGDWSKKIEEMTSHACFDRLVSKVLVIRAIDDEASLTIAAGAIANRLSNLLIYFFVRFSHLLFLIIVYGMRIIPIVMIIVLFSLFINNNSIIVDVVLDKITPNLDYVSYVVSLSFAILVVAVISLLTMCGFFRAVYGREMILVGLDLEVNAQSSPDGTSISTVTLVQSERGFRLRHGIYDDLECNRRLLDWINREIMAAKRSFIG